MMKKVCTVLGGIVGLVLVVVLLTINNQRNVEESISDAIISYRDYLDEKDASFSYSDKVHATYDYLENFDHDDDEVRLEVEKILEKDMNYMLERMMGSDVVSVSTLNSIGYIIEESYVSQSNKELYDGAYVEAQDRREFLSNATEEDVQRARKYNANRIEIGYSEEAVLEKLGTPDDTTKSVSAQGEFKILQYGNRLIYLSDGVVDRVVDL